MAKEAIAEQQTELKEGSKTNTILVELVTKSPLAAIHNLSSASWWETVWSTVVTEVSKNWSLWSYYSWWSYYSCNCKVSTYLFKSVLARMWQM